MAASPKLEVRQVSHQFRKSGQPLPVLEDINFAIQPGEFCTLIGPSGSGKSTLFNIITGLLDPQEGTIRFDGNPTQHRLGKSAYMPQEHALLPWRSVLDNVVLGPEIRFQNRRKAIARARELLPLFGLNGFEKAFPAELSGGMRQRAALLRTFLMGQDILLLDEPFGALDALTRRDLQAWLLEVWEVFGYTVLFITHDIEEAVMLSDRVIVLSERPGRILKISEINLPRPRHQHLSPFSAELMSYEAEILKTLKAIDNGTTGNHPQTR